MSLCWVRAGVWLSPLRQETEDSGPLFPRSALLCWELYLAFFFQGGDNWGPFGVVFPLSARGPTACSGNSVTIDSWLCLLGMHPCYLWTLLTCTGEYSLTFSSSLRNGGKGFWRNAKMKAVSHFSRPHPWPPLFFLRCPDSPTPLPFSIYVWYTPDLGTEAETGVSEGIGKPLNCDREGTQRGFRVGTDYIEAQSS